MKTWSPGPALVSAPLAKNCQAVVIVPVRNEELFVESALRALVSQVDVEGNPLPEGQYEIIVLLNNCTDDSAKLVQAFAQANSRITIHIVALELPPHHANIGHVRRLLMNEACRRFLQADKLDGAILSTDADTTVSLTWVARNTRALANGWDAVGGRIVLDAREREALPEHVRRGYQLDIRYNVLRSQMEAMIDPDVCDPWPRHHQHFAASLGVRADVYRRVGGIPDVNHLEDVALWEVLRLEDARLRHSPAIIVNTSARMEGRVSVGLSGHLRGFDNSSNHLVESAALLKRRFRAHRFFRRAWTGYRRASSFDLATASNIQEAAELSGLDSRILRCALERESMWSKALQVSHIDAQITRNASQTVCSMPLVEAVDSLRSMLSGTR